MRATFSVCDDEPEEPRVPDLDACDHCGRRRAAWTCRGCRLRLCAALGPLRPAELGRALVESRLGVPVEDALERIGERLNNDDFSWVVMAIRIQREVGGNLAELLTTVADTLRERERLRRQVDVLSAEGRLSGIILGCLPLGFAAYLLVTRPEYLAPMLTPFGLVLVATAVVLLAVGGVWVARVVKVEV